jgi:hypothetical protein
MRSLLLGGGILVLVGLLALTQVMNSSNGCRPIPPLFARLVIFEGEMTSPSPPSGRRGVRELLGRKLFQTPCLAGAPDMCLPLSPPREYFLIKRAPLCPDLGVARRESCGNGGGGCRAAAVPRPEQGFEDVLGAHGPIGEGEER